MQDPGVIKGIGENVDREGLEDRDRRLDVVGEIENDKVGFFEVVSGCEAEGRV